MSPRSTPSRRSIRSPAGGARSDDDPLYAQLESLSEAFRTSGLSAADIAAVGITNQRETTIVWEKETGRPVYNAIVWQCRRTAPLCEELRADGLGREDPRKTGLLIDAYFSGTKLRWILDNVPGARERAERGELLSARWTHGSSGI